MRKIKFRGIYVDTGEWVYGYYVERTDPHDPSHKIYDPLNGTCHDIRPETVGQYIDDKDEDGKEIFEGELLNPIRGFTGDIYQVIFDLSGFRWLLIYDEHFGRNVSKEHQTAPFHFGLNYKIIGNIHQNVELLK